MDGKTSVTKDNCNSEVDKGGNGEGNGNGGLKSQCGKDGELTKGKATELSILTLSDAQVNKTKSRKRKDKDKSVKTHDKDLVKHAQIKRKGKLKTNTKSKSTSDLLKKSPTSNDNPYKRRLCNYSEKQNIKEDLVQIKIGYQPKKKKLKLIERKERKTDIRGYLFQSPTNLSNNKEFSDFCLNKDYSVNALTPCDLNVDSRSDLNVYSRSHTKSVNAPADQTIVPFLRPARELEVQCKEVNSRACLVTGLVDNCIKIDHLNNYSMASQKDMEIPEFRYDPQIDRGMIEQLEKKIETLQENTIERLLLELKMDMKKDSMQTKEILSQVATNNNSLMTKVANIESKNTELDTKITTMESLQGSEQVRLTETKQELVEVKEDMKILKDIVEKQSQYIKNIEQNSDNNDVRALRNNLIISGVDEEENENNERTVSVLANFFSQTMKITEAIAISSAQRMGKGTKRTIKATLKNVKDKGLIYKNSKNLKGLKNQSEGGYYINDHLPAAIQEQFRNYRDIMRCNKLLPEWRTMQHGH